MSSSAPPSDRPHGSARVPQPFVPALLMLSVVCLTLAPTLMPDSYSWVQHTTSESAAQGVAGAWMARLGFVAFGGGVLALAVLRRERWGLAATALHGAFVLSASAIVACVVIPLAMLGLPTIRGALQRLMFAVAYAWYGRESLRIRTTGGPVRPSPAADGASKSPGHDE